MCMWSLILFFFFSSRRRHTRSDRDWSSDVCSSDLDRHQPARLWTVLLRLGIGEEAPLAQHDAPALLRDAHQRIADLPDPAVRQLEDRLPGGFVERPPEIVGGGVRLAVPAHVEADAVAEALLAQVALDHAQDGAALLVGDGVERLAGLLGVLHLGADGVRALERVEMERGPLAHLEV